MVAKNSAIISGTITLVINSLFLLKTIAATMVTDRAGISMASPTVWAVRDITKLFPSKVHGDRIGCCFRYDLIKRLLAA